MKEDFIRIIQNIQVILNDIEESLKEINLINEIKEQVKDINNLLDFDFEKIKNSNLIEDEIKNNLVVTIKQAKFLIIDCSDMNITDQPQYKLVINQFNEFIKYIDTLSKKESNNKEKFELDNNIIKEFLTSFSNDGFIKEIDDFEKIYNVLKEYKITEDDIYLILINLVEFDIKQKQILKTVEPLQEEVEKEINEEEFNEEIEELETSKIEEANIIKSNEKLSIEDVIEDITSYYRACDILADNKDELREALREFKVKESRVSSWYNVYEQSDIYNTEIISSIPNEYLKKVLLVYIKKYLTEIDLTLEREDFTFKDKFDYIELWNQAITKAVNDYELSFNINEDNYENEGVNDLIFLQNVENEFDSNQLREHHFRHQILSGLNELKENNFNGSNKLESCDAFSKKKGGPGGVGGIRIGYVPLSNNIILILSVFSRQNGYSNLTNIYNNNKDLIDYLSKMSKNPKTRDTLIKLEEIKLSSLDFRNQIYDLIDNMNKKKKGGLKND